MKRHSSTIFKIFKFFKRLYSWIKCYIKRYAFFNISNKINNVIDLWACKYKLITKIPNFLIRPVSLQCNCKNNWRKWYDFCLNIIPISNRFKIEKCYLFSFLKKYCIFAIFKIFIHHYIFLIFILWCFLQFSL